MDMREFFEQANPTNLAQMIERMLEAERKDYWETDAETMKMLVETYLDVARQHDVLSDNEAFNEYLTNQAQGYGLDLAGVPMAQAALAGAQPEVVTGQELKQVEQSETDIMAQWQRFALFGLLFAAFALGAGWQARQVRVGVPA